MELFNNIKIDVVKQLQKLHLTLDHLYALERLLVPKFNLENDSCLNIPDNIMNGLMRRGYLAGLNVTDQGRLLYSTLSNPDFFISELELKKELKKVKAAQSIQWLEFLSIYPATASWITPSGTNLESSRKLRQDSLDNEKKYLAILASGVSHEDMKSVLMYQIELIKRDSIKNRTNKMEYMQGTTPWLNQKTYSNYLEEMKKKNWKPDSLFWNKEGKERVVEQQESLDIMLS